MFLTITNANISARNAISGQFLNFVEFIHPSFIDERFCGTRIKQNFDWEIMIEHRRCDLCLYVHGKQTMFVWIVRHTVQIATSLQKPIHLARKMAECDCVLQNNDILSHQQGCLHFAQKLSSARCGDAWRIVWVRLLPPHCLSNLLGIGHVPWRLTKVMTDH